MHAEDARVDSTTQRRFNTFHLVQWESVTRDWKATDRGRTLVM